MDPGNGKKEVVVVGTVPSRLTGGPIDQFSLVLDLATLTWRKVNTSPYTNNVGRGESVETVQHGFTFLGVGGSVTIDDVQVSF